MTADVQTAIEILAGALLALGLIGLARRLGREVWIYGVGLIVAAAVYPVAAAVAGASGRLPLEGLGLLLFGGVGLLGMRGRPGLLAAGWALHVAWDLALHPWALHPGGSSYVHAGYPTLCAGFDLLLAGYLLRLALDEGRVGSGAA